MHEQAVLKKLPPLLLKLVEQLFHWLDLADVARLTFAGTVLKKLLAASMLCHSTGYMNQTYTVVTGVVVVVLVTALTGYREEQ